MNRREIIRYLVLRTIGNFLVLFAIFGVIATFGPALYFEVQFQIQKIYGFEYELPESASGTPTFGAVYARVRGEEGEESNPDLFGSIISGSKSDVLVPKSAEFSLIIPKIGANQRVIENVDPTDRDIYMEALTKGVAHARGSNFPGEGGTTYMFAHSADVFWNVGRYNADFYLLKDLVENDEIVVTYQNRIYKYEVSEKRTVDPSEVEFLTSDRGQGEELILQTCWPPGTTWKRMLVFAEPVGS